jgi:Microtubule-binding calmodulin-regulated spectrin-associated
MVPTKTKALSNVQQIRNALSHVCMAGAHFDSQREEALGVIEKMSRQSETITAQPDDINPAVTQFVILFFHSKSLSFRGIYAVDPVDGALRKVFGRGPRVLLEAYAEEFFKFETSSRSFKPLHTKTVTSTTDAVSVDPAKLKRLLAKQEQTADAL